MTVTAITLRNYRSFGPRGARLELDRQFVGVVGVNNSGKSTAVRALYEIRPLLLGIAATQFGNGAIDLAFVRGAGFGGPTLGSGERVRSTRNPDLDPRVTIEFSSEVDAREGAVRDLTLVLLQDGNIRLEITLPGGEEWPQGQAPQVGAQGSPPRNYLQAIVGGHQRLVDWDAVRADLQWLAHSFYIGPFRNAVNAGGGQYYDLAIGRAFIDAFEGQKTGPDPVANDAIIEMVAELADIFGFERLEISPAQGHETLTLSIDGRSQRGTEVGAGIQQFIIVAASVLVRRPSILLIDEPELNLHASLQERFLALLAQYVSGPVLFATHSLGLARSVADSVMVASRGTDGTAELNLFNADRNLALSLGELGYGGRFDVAFKAVLLVEGVTEVRTFQELLTTYGVRNQVAVLSLGGDDLAKGDRIPELTELRKLADRVYAIVDSERTSEGEPAKPAREAFANDCARLGIACTVLERRSTENYLDLQSAVNEMSLAPGTELGPFDKYPPEWDKRKNWRVARSMPPGALDETDLGRALARIATDIAEENSTEPSTLP